jgi:hypothetical protein
VRPQASGLSLGIISEIGSDFSVKSHQNSTISEIAALWGGFFSGGAQRLPVRFQGGIGKLTRHKPRILYFVSRQSRHAPRPAPRDILISGIQIISRTTLFDHSNSRFAQVSSANLYSSEAAF